MAYCGICGTDLHEYLGGPIFPPPSGQKNPYTGAELPVILGHEFCGTIVEVGRDVAGFSVGQKAAVNPAMDDRHHGREPCELCVVGRHNICEHVTFYGLNANGGGFSDEITLKPICLVPVPDSLPLKLAGLAEPLAVAWHMIRMSGFEEGQDVVVLGAGPIGCALTFLLRTSGARRILVSEISASRAERAADFGADKVVNPMDGSSQERPFPESDAVCSAVHEMMGIGADITFDACGLQATLDTAIACTKPGGVVFNVAIHEKPLSIQLNSLTLTEKKLLGGLCYTREDFEKVIGVLSTAGGEAEKFITSVVPLENAIEGGFHELINNTADHVKILISVSGDDA